MHQQQWAKWQVQLCSPLRTRRVGHVCQCVPAQKERTTGLKSMSKLQIWQQGSPNCLFFYIHWHENALPFHNVRYKRTVRKDLAKIKAKIKHVNTSTVSKHKVFDSVEMRPFAWLIGKLMARFKGRDEQFTISKLKRNWSQSYTRSFCVPSWHCHTWTWSFFRGRLCTLSFSPPPPPHTFHYSMMFI